MYVYTVQYAHITTDGRMHVSAFTPARAFARRIRRSMAMGSAMFNVRCCASWLPLGVDPKAARARGAGGGTRARAERVQWGCPKGAQRAPTAMTIGARWGSRPMVFTPTRDVCCAGAVQATHNNTHSRHPGSLLATKLSASLRPADSSAA